MIILPLRANIASGVLHILLVISFLSIVNCFQLEPIIVKPIVKFDRTITIVENDSSVFIMAFSRMGFNINNQLPIGTNIATSVLHLFADEITSLVASKNYHHSLKWYINIDDNIGLLQMVEINADIQNMIVRIFGKSINLIQPIPQQYEIKRQCILTNKRRYRFIIRPKKSCYDHQTPRELNIDEIKQVNNKLKEKASQIRYLLN